MVFYKKKMFNHEQRKLTPTKILTCKVQINVLFKKNTKLQSESNFYLTPYKHFDYL